MTAPHLIPPMGKEGAKIIAEIAAQLVGLPYHQRFGTVAAIFDQLRLQIIEGAPANRPAIECHAEAMACAVFAISKSYAIERAEQHPEILQPPAGSA